MEKDKLQSYIDQNLSAREIGNLLNISKSGIQYWIRKHKLKTNTSNNYIFIKNGIKFKVCPRCLEEKELENNFTRYKNSANTCKKCKSIQKNERYRENKRKCVDYLGGKCSGCGYNKYLGALEFHHKNPNEKKFKIASYANRKFENLKDELDKCELLCRNCHGEIRSELTLSNGKDVKVTSDIVTQKHKYNKVTIENEKKVKVCAECCIKKTVDENFAIYNGQVYAYCRKCHNKRGSILHQKRKKEYVNYKGGKCIKCGYNKCVSSLDFHHKNPMEKNFQIGAKPKLLKSITEELNLCELLCRNCHAETHAEL